jgi:DNA-binding MarR family transcriptional regulator
MESTTPVPPESLDTGTLALFTGYVLADEVSRELAAGGHSTLRFSHGFLFQHLVDGPRAIGDIAVRMGITQQAVSKTAKELQDLGYVMLTQDPWDRRVRNCALTERGWEAIGAARRARLALEQRLEVEIGAHRLCDVRRVLAAILEGHGGAQAIRARRVRPPG